MIFIKLFFTFFKIGLFTFGGGYAMLPLIQAEIIGNGWATINELINFVAISESTPGPFAINISTYIGSETGGTFASSVTDGFGILLGRVIGSFCATLGVVLPSFIIILIVAQCFEKFKSSKTVKGLMSGLKPAVIGLIGTAILSMAKTVFFEDGFTLDVFSDIKTYISIAIVAVMSIFAFKNVHPIIIICLSAVIGIIAGYVIF